ncbi:glycosyltransferase [Plastoroseomonas arctica]|uniref:Uncharacterized protein n=1 Tax=Plastoroseomonas arctica TaxID=1509237 RepID=A0AAF1JU67_9PROT|nr:glycosyltransferase [Plastoroseomonas arctica]MBR0653725.1 hypothetical protein [Plastoroseomonas arctica]
MSAAAALAAAERDLSSGRMVPALRGFTLAEADPAHALPAAIGAARAALRLAWCDTALRAARRARVHLGGAPLGELPDAQAQHAHLRRELRICRARLREAPGPGNLAPVVEVLTSAGRLRAARALLGTDLSDPLLRLADAGLALREGQGSGALVALAAEPGLPEWLCARLADTLLSAGEGDAARALAAALPPALGLPIQVRAGLFDDPPEARLRDAEAWRDAATDVSQATDAARHGLTAALDAERLLLDQVPRLPAAPHRATLFAYWDSPAPPDDVAAVFASWARHNPGLALRRFDRVTAQAYVGERQGEAGVAGFDACPNPSFRSNLLRAAALYAEGGLYADADERCLAPIADWIALARRDFLAAVSSERPHYLHTQFLGAPPGHPLLRAALATMIADLVAAGRAGVALRNWESGGPGCFTRALMAVRAGSAPTLRLLSTPAYRARVELADDLAYKRDAAANWRV